jgi:hypothetical protein
MSTQMKIFLFTLIALGLPACSSSSAPRLIAAYPIEGQSGVAQPGAPSNIVYIQHATIDLEVTYVERAAEKAQEMVYQFNGYPVSSQTWWEDNQPHIILVLAVPASNFEHLYRALLRLGDAEHAQVSGSWEQSRSQSWMTFSEISLHLFSQRPGWQWPELPGGWRPLQTLEDAIHVSLTIFGFIVDVLIWMIVVLGPFFLLGYAGRTLYRRWSSKK